MISNVPKNGSLVAPHIYSGENVRADDWSALISALQYLNGSNGTIVCAHNPLVSEETTDTKTLRYRAIPRSNCVARLWIIGMAGGNNAEIEIRIPEDAVSPTATFRAPSFQILSTLLRPPMLVVEEVADPADEDMSIGFTPTVGGMLGWSIQVIELPRRTMGDTTWDLGVVHPQTVAPGQRVQNRGTVAGVDGGAYSLAGIAKAAEYAAINARRSCLFAWSVPEEDVAEYTSTDWSDAWTLGPVLARKIDTGETQRVVRVAARVEITGTGGDVRFTAESGDTVTIAADGAGVSGDDPPWYFADLEVDVDLRSTDSYGRTGREIGDIVTCDFRADAASGISITSLLIGEYDDVD